jgi:hypothetical protein
LATNIGKGPNICDSKPLKKNPNPTIIPSGRRVSKAERDKKKKKLQPCKVGGVPGLGQAEQYCTLSKPVH